MEQSAFLCKVCDTLSPSPGPCLVHVAAPDLLEACKAAESIVVLADFPGPELLSGLLVTEQRIAAMGPQLRAAIAKAQGGKEQRWREWAITPPRDQTIKGEAGGSESTT